jgi:ribosome recycling factor
VSLRNHRRVAVEQLKEGKRKKLLRMIPHGHDRVQKSRMTSSVVDKTIKTKEEEIMEV